MVRKRVLNTLQPQIFKQPRGRKEVWLPNWHVTLLRNSDLPPNQAHFQVPLNITKLDLKDYLFHAYGIPALSVRSSVYQPPPKRRERDGVTYRPQPVKRMIVEMDTSYRGGPFAWPEEPTDFRPWDKELFDTGKKQRDEVQEDQSRYGEVKARKEPGVFGQQIAALKEGKQVWRPTWVERNNHNAQQLGIGTPSEIRKKLEPRIHPSDS